MKEFILAFIGGVCPAVLFNIERKNLVWAGISGALGWVVYSGVRDTGGGVVFSTFVGAIVVGFYSEVMARLLKTPASVFSVPGIFPLVPGIIAYNTVLAIVANDSSQAYNLGVETIASAGAIAFGVMLISAVFRFIRIWRYGRSE